MSSFLIFNNLHMGAEILGAIVFFIAAWLFSEAYREKKDIFSIGRSLGFLFLSGWQVLHATYEISGTVGITAVYVYIVGLLLILLSYGIEKLPSRPDGFSAGAFLISPIFLLGRISIIAPLFLGTITVVLIKRYFKNIDKLIKWLAIGFLFLTVSSVVSIYVQIESPTPLWITEHLLKIAGFAMVGLWIWQWLSLRLRENVLITFVGTSLIIALLVTTMFSMFSVQRIEKEVIDSLNTNAKTFGFYIESLKNKSLASVQIIANNEDFASAVKFKDTKDLERISKNLLSTTDQQFITVAEKNGNVFFKLDFPIAKDENILAEKIGAEALEGQTAVTVGGSGAEGFSIRASSPIFDDGKIVGALITGFLLDEPFASNFKEISKFETTVFSDGKVSGSTLLPKGEEFGNPTIKDKLSRGEEFTGKVNFLNQDIIGVFLPLKGDNNQVLGVLAITTSPGELLRNAQEINRLTMLIILIIVLSLTIPLYRFTIVITS